jgi:transcriptional regulator with XRE-family HTH domain
MCALVMAIDGEENAAMAKELLKLRMKHGLSLNDVADICGFDVVYVARMELGVPVTLFYARRLRRRLAAHLDVPLTEAVLPVVLIGDEGGSNIQIGMRE